MPIPVVQLICQFGLPVRGLSPYGTSLLNSLDEEMGKNIQPVDYKAPYPQILHPANGLSVSTDGEIHWGNPFSWYRVTRSNADIIHFQHWLAPMAGFLAPFAAMAKRANKRVVITVHNPSAHETLAWTTSLEKKFFMMADVLVVHDERGASVLRKRLGKTEATIRVIPHGVEVEMSSVAAEKKDYSILGLDSTRRYICIFGNLRGYKGIDVLLDAWSKAVGRLPDVDLVIAGRLWSGKSGIGSRIVASLLGTDKDAARLRTALARTELQGRVHLREGFQADESIASLLRLSELAVFPYVRFDSQSGAACRAVGMGCPVMVTDVGGLPDLAIDSEWVVSPGDTEALASRLYEKLSQPGSLSAKRALQLESVRKYAWRVVADAHAKLYQELL